VNNMKNEKVIREELKKINEMSRIINGVEPLNGIEHTILWILGEKSLMSPSAYVDPYKRN